MLTLLEPQSRFGDKPVKFQVVLSPNGTAVLKGLIAGGWRGKGGQKKLQFNWMEKKESKKERCCCSIPCLSIPVSRGHYCCGCCLDADG